MRTLFFSLFQVAILIVLFIFNKDFAWVMLVCTLPMLAFFLYDDFKKKRK